MAFTHLHVHTEYSLLDGAARIKDVVARAKELGMDSLAITDHGVMFGVIDFYRECKAAGIKPIIGCEVYMAARTRFDKEADRDKHQNHLILLAKNDTGYHNLMKIVSAGFTEGFYYKPRVDKEVLREHSEGIICLSACVIGKIQSLLIDGDYDGAKAEACDMIEIFGRENFFLELQDQGLPEEARILPFMKQLSRELEVPLVATNDVHYVRREDAEAHDVLLCIQTATTVDDPDRMRFPNDEFYLKSEEEMRAAFPYAPEAIDNTQLVADACNVEIEFGGRHLPEFQVPDGKTASAYLRELCDSGMVYRYGEGWREKTLDASAGAGTLGDRLEYELGVIEKMGFVEYFLIVWDFINYAKSNGIMVGPGRGSAAGSIVAYALRITDIDPIKYGLIFERFLNPERVTMPDIDVDFCYERRGEVIDYVIEKYGEDNVAQIITFGTLKAKAAVRDCGRALNLSYAETDAVAKAIPFDLHMTIDLALKMNPKLREMCESDERVAKVINMSRALEGMPRHASTHAAGVVISKKAISEYVPLYMADKGISTQFTMTTIEELGLLKMDFLGLRNLTVIRDALELIEKDCGDKVDFASMEMNDPKVFELISSGNTQGVFQLESAGMTQFMKNLRPTCLEDVIAGISLYRPGPMGSIPTYIENKKNSGRIKYLHPALEPILSVTYGCLVYQEQVMQIVRDLGGYSYGRSDLVRRAMSKKKEDVMRKEKEYFINGKLNEDGSVDVPGCVRNGIPAAVAEEIFNQMVSFASYAFNKSHAAAYAVLAYETAYLKTYYPKEFMAALMTSVMGNAPSMAKYINNCREMGIEVLPPSVNDSEMKFSVKDGKIRFALPGVKNVGLGPARAILAARERDGQFTDLRSFIDSVDLREVNKKVVESLIKAGAFETLNANRAQLMAVYEGLLESAQAGARANLEGQMSLFGAVADEIKMEMPNIRNFEKKQLMAMEKEMLGVYLTDHPLTEFAERLKRSVSVTAADLEGEEPEVSDGEKVVMGGIVTHRKTLVTKKNKMMAFVDAEDLTGSFEVVVFPNVYERCAALTEEDSIVLFYGNIDFKEDEAPKLLVEDIVPLEGQAAPQATAAGVKPTSLLKLRLASESEIEDVKTILLRHSGGVPVRIYLPDGRQMAAERKLWADGSEDLLSEMAALLGKDNVKL